MKIDRFGVGAALVFFTSAAATIAWCGSMASMPGMDMPGGWVMSMAWMRMPGQGWLETAVCFMGMWSLMMVAMMTPVLAPHLSRYRCAVDGARRNAVTACVAGGYFAVWLLSGALLFPLGAAFAQLTMLAPEFSAAAPLMGAAVVIGAGVAQFSTWKVRQLEMCSHAPDRNRAHPPTCSMACRQGVSLGLRCFYCCAGLTAVLLVIGVMDLRAMALVTMAISAERLLPARLLAARVVGLCMIVMGVSMFVASN